MNQNFLALLAFLLLLPLIALAADFDGDGNTDLLWQDISTGERRIWLMDGIVYSKSVSLGFISQDWNIVATADFNSDSKPDLVWENSSTGEHVVWLMNGTTTGVGRAVNLGTISPSWKIVGTGDFNADSKPDLLWQNPSTGQLVVWLMNSIPGRVTSVTITSLPAEWRIAGVADFNADAKPDLLWQNRFTGQRLIWLMNGTTFTADVSLGVIESAWEIAGAGDFNQDGQPDIVWQNPYSGQRAIWIMNGTSRRSNVNLPPAPINPDTAF